ncbi:MAG: hypothetical protein QM704_07150 [Anaeromyxobacteraceae bacterium]
MRSVLSRLAAWLRRAPPAPDLSAPAGPEAPSSAAVEANDRGHAARDASDLEAAVLAYGEAARLAPGWEAAWFNLGIVTKQSGRWDACRDACRRALALEPSEGAWWNLAVACTALGDWAGAREGWRACGIEVPDGDGPLEMHLGSVPIRVDPGGSAEVVWCDRIDPARAIVRNVPMPECGRRYGDLVLHDGAPNGYRKRGDREVPVFDELALLAASGRSTFVVTTDQPTPEDSSALAAAFEAARLPAEDWTLQVRMICKACSEGRPHAEGEEHAPDPEWKTSHEVGIAAVSVEPVLAVLSAWATGGSGRGYGTLELALAGTASA